MLGLRKSRYCFLINKGDDYLAYTTAANSFYKINSYVAELIENFGSEKLKNNSEEIETLHKLKLLTTEEEDDSVVDLLRMKYMMRSYAQDFVGITLLPTTACNLRCPYCFEKNKQAYVMSNEICDKVIDFIKSHHRAKGVSITWYGGEPLLGSRVIKYMLSKIDTLGDVKFMSHGMITNGTLLFGKNLEIFREHPLNSIQITLDGNKDTHDTKRIYANGRGSYDRIIENLKAFVEAYPDTYVSIRVNIDKNNAGEFMTVYETIKGLFPKKKNINVYPGILKCCGKQSEDSPFMMNKDVVKIKTEYRKRGCSFDFPRIVASGCCATSLTSYVIGPRGEIYKCWEDVGEESLVVGNINEKTYTNMPLLAKYMLHGSHILEEECRECPLLPVCSNDCAKNRLSNKFMDAGYDLCSIYKSKDYAELNDMLYDFYQGYVKAKDANKCDHCC